MGPYRQWPTGMGFEYFYGFLGGETNQWYPALYEGITPVEPDKTPEEGYYFNDDLTTHDDQVDPPAEGADAGQAVLRLLRARAPPTRRTTCRRSGPTGTRASSTRAGTRCARRRSPARRSWASSRADCDLTERSPGIPAWDDVDPEMKPVLARQMEIYAGYLENTDHHVGLLIDTLEDLGILDETLIYVIIGDNGASAEGSLQGTFNEMITLGGFGGARDGRVHVVEDRPVRRARGLQPLRRRLGPRHGHARTSGPSRSRRTGAAPATARSSTGRPASRPRARSARSSTTSSTSPRPCSRSPACRTR